MKYYYYIITDQNHEHLNSGFSKDIIETIKLYKELPTLNPEKAITKLIFLVDASDENMDEKSLKKLLLKTKAEKIQMIERFNPEWLELQPNINFEL